MLDNANAKKVVIGVVLLIAVVFAIWSGIRNFGPQGRTIGTLGTITETTNNAAGPTKPEATSSSGTSVNGPTKPEDREKNGDAALSGAPSDAGKAP